METKESEQYEVGLETQDPLGRDFYFPVNMGTKRSVFVGDNHNPCTDLNVLQATRRRNSDTGMLFVLGKNSRSGQLTVSNPPAYVGGSSGRVFTKYGTNGYRIREVNPEKGHPIEVGSEIYVINFDSARVSDDGELVSGLEDALKFRVVQKA